MGAELFYAQGRTGRHEEANSRFSVLRTRIKITQVEVDGRNEHVPLLLERKFAK
jgi:hypothetical protein